MENFECDEWKRISKEFLSFVHNDAGYLIDSELFDERKNITTDLECVLQDWVNLIALKNNIPPSSDAYGSRLLIFGATLLECVTKDSDVDCILVVPAFIKHEDFFTSLSEFLMKNKLFGKIRIVRGAYVPLIEMEFMKIKIDLLLAIVNLPSIKKVIDFHNLEILKCMDNESIKSINGYRDGFVLRDLVPNQEEFIKLSKVIKHWAKCQNISNSAFGFLGSYAWMLLAAYICQQYSNASLPQLILHFYQTFSTWNWSRPILLKPLEEDVLCLNQWNPQVNPDDNLHKMSVITPCYPCHNAAFTVDCSTREIIIRELKRGLHIVKVILDEREDVSLLFQPLDFYRLYRNYMILSMECLSQEIYNDWSGLIAAKLRHFCLELSKIDKIKLVHPFPKCHLGLIGTSCFWVIGLQIEKAEGPVVLDISKAFDDFKRKVDVAAEGRGFPTNQVKMSTRHIKRNELATFINSADS